MIRGITGLFGLLLLGALPSHAQPSAAPAMPSITVQPATPALRADITATRDILTLGDLISGLQPAVAALPAFRAPALGDTGTIQTLRVLEAARSQGVERVADGGHAQVVVTRAARRISVADIDAAIRKAVEERFGVDLRAFTLQLDQGLPAHFVEPDLEGVLAAQDIAFEPRSRRISAALVMPGSAATRLRPLRVAGQMIETVEVAVPLRALARGEILRAGDVMIDRRPREGLSTDVLSDPAAAVGKAARRAIAAGQVLRASDLQRQEIVARNEMVTVTYEAPGLMLTMRGRAQEAGAQGDIIAVQNVQSRKVLQAVVTGPGRVAVTGAVSGRVASAP
jgi:flagella basal body P-ring formation protein FlgA